MFQPLSARLQGGVGLLQRSSTRHALGVPCGSACLLRGGMSGLPCSAQSALDEVAPTCTPAVIGPCARTIETSTRLHAILARACQRLWLVSFHGACGGSLMLGVSSRLALRPPDAGSLGSSLTVASSPRRAEVHSTAASDPTVASHAGAVGRLRTEPQVCAYVFIIKQLTVQLHVAPIGKERSVGGPLGFWAALNRRAGWPSLPGRG